MWRVHGKWHRHLGLNQKSLFRNRRLEVRTVQSRDTYYRKPTFEYQNKTGQISSLRLSIVTHCPQHIVQIPLPINALRCLSSHQLLQRHGPRFQLHGTFPAEGADPVHYLFSSLSPGHHAPVTGMPMPSYLLLWSSLLFPESGQNASFFLKSPPLLKKAVHIF